MNLGSLVVSLLKGKALAVIGASVVLCRRRDCRHGSHPDRTHT